jgi:hypothetical protein
VSGDLEPVRAKLPANAPAEYRTVGELLEQQQLIGQAMAAAMKPEQHYGVIPGTKGKPSLLKPGAELLMTLFRLGAEYDVDEHYDGERHYRATVKATLRHIPTGNWVGTGVGSCTSREERYAFRNETPTCPSCGSNEFLLKAKDRPEWFCWRNPSKGKNGCGKTFPLDEPAIASQAVGKVPNPNIADTYNTVLKMAQKRALIAAVLNATAASEVFTQDVEDFRPPPAGSAGPAEPASGGGGGASGADAPAPAAKETAKQPAPADAWQAVLDLAAHIGRGGDREAVRRTLDYAKERARELGYTAEVRTDEGPLQVWTNEGIDFICAQLRSLEKPELPADDPPPHGSAEAEGDGVLAGTVVGHDHLQSDDDIPF